MEYGNVNVKVINVISMMKSRRYEGDAGHVARIGNKI
jgi:hypothetical protein